MIGADKGAAVIDLDHHAAAILEIGDLDIARQRQGRHGRREIVHVEPFAVRGHAAVELRAIPGGLADLVIIRVLARIVLPAGHLIGLAEKISAAALGQRTVAAIDRAADAGERVALGGPARAAAKRATAISSRIRPMDL